MAEGIKATFAQCKKENRPALVGYFTAGYPTKEECPDIMLGLQAGGVGTWRQKSLRPATCPNLKL